MGKIVRAHGLRGQVVVDLLTNRTERVEPGAVLHSDRGQLRVVSSSPAPAGAGRDRWIVSFDGIRGRQAAEDLRGLTLSAAPLDDPDALWVHELINSVVEDSSGREIGTVREIQANPASDLIVLDSGGLIPLRFVVAHDQGRVTVEMPEGLLDL